LICAFIAEHRARFGVAPMCRVLSEHGCQIAPRTFYAWARRAPSKRSLSDLALTGVLAGFYEPDEHGKRPPECLYGSLKMWAHLNREGIQVAAARSSG
jgi:putative transposase